jgi:hypothetical protein
MWKYYRHIFKSAGQDTFAFFVRKIVMAVSVLLLVGVFTWRFYATSFDFFRSIEIPLLCYGVVLGSMFIISLVRAPVLLDEEQAKEIGRLNLKVQETDDAEKIRSSKKKIEGTLGGLVHEGRQLFNKLERCGAPSELSNCVNETEEWKVKVTQELQSARPTEAPLFSLLMLTQPLLGALLILCIRQKCKGES